MILLLVLQQTKSRSLRAQTLVRNESGLRALGPAEGSIDVVFERSGIKCVICCCDAFQARSMIIITRHSGIPFWPLGCSLAWSWQMPERVQDAAHLFSRVEACASRRCQASYTRPRKCRPVSLRSLRRTLSPVANRAISVIKRGNLDCTAVRAR